ncbi:hypothetical protein [Photobacterium leiognathi]|uniref:hypothetical protein n=1 Tax=Photobacterium leiognathi TaxID=553611 RepID=UPI0029815B4B|nr:hypothetical protein [Photobacterium leiognathi]
MKKLALTILVSSILIGCGGGGSDESTVVNPSNPSTDVPLIPLEPSTPIPPVEPDTDEPLIPLEPSTPIPPVEPELGVWEQIANELNFPQDAMLRICSKKEVKCEIEDEKPKITYPSSMGNKLNKGIYYPKANELYTYSTVRIMAINNDKGSTSFHGMVGANHVACGVKSTNNTYVCPSILGGGKGETLFATNVGTVVGEENMDYQLYAKFRPQEGVLDAFYQASEIYVDYQDLRFNTTVKYKYPQMSEYSYGDGVVAFDIASDKDFIDLMYHMSQQGL